MKKEVLFVILDKYSDREYPLLADALHFGIQEKESPYVVKTLSITKQIVHSIGGFSTIPDYDLDSVPSDYAGLVLIGGYSWNTPEARRLIPLIKNADVKGLVIAGICKATEFLGSTGVLNNRKHTSNSLKNLKNISGTNYTGEANYLSIQSVRDQNLVTANGTAFLEFAKDVLLALNAFPEEDIESYYKLYKDGYIEFKKTAGDVQIFK